LPRRAGQRDGASPTSRPGMVVGHLSTRRP
jgi:hypothetical protein